MANIFSARIGELRKVMEKEGIAATLVIHTDPHHSEYLAPHWQVRRWLSGFTGSAGDLLVTHDDALLWTDSRYFLQAEQQLDGSGIKLMKADIPGTPTINDYLLDNLQKGDKIGVDGMLQTVDEARQMSAVFRPHHIDVVQFDAANLWTDRPALSDDKAFIHSTEFAGETAKSRMYRVMERVNAADADATVICALDEIAWILNLRGSDVKCTPVVTSFLYLEPGNTVIFIDDVKLTDEVRNYLAENDVKISPYNQLLDFLPTLDESVRVLYNPATTAKTVAEAVKNPVEAESPVALIKACKNPVQIECLRNALNRDSVALINLFMEIERRLDNGEKLTEMDVAELAIEFRARDERYFDESFETIAGYKEHGAIVHYTADENSNATIKPEGLLLVDSGAQYLDGTTDITRTITLGKITDEERRDFTLVMKGHIALARAKFPEGTRGAQLDALARQFLWAEGKSYLHGTGHGVGFFLGVHEGPHSIRLNNAPTPLFPGMVTSNEPGVYIAGKYGIRCENLVLTVEDEENEFGRFYRFETLTLFPFDLNLFDTTIMSDEEIQWVNDYHARCRKVLLPHLNHEQAAWLKAKTEPLKR